jgi:hypothetical protein
MPFLQKGNGIKKLLYVYDSPDTAGIHGKHSLALDSGMTAAQSAPEI